MSKLKSPLVITSSGASNIIRTDFEVDAYHIRNHGTTIVSLHAFDTASHDNHTMSQGHEKGKRIKHCAHRDHIQLIPPSIAGLTNQQYAAHQLRDTTILNSVGSSAGHMQGIVAFDGIIKGLIIKGYMINTKSVHHITINGAIDPIIEDCHQQDGSPAHIILNPLRLGGGENIHVLSFKDKDDQYQPAKITGFDNRQQKITKKGHINLHKFDLKRFRNEVENNLPYPHHQPKDQQAITYCKQIKELALTMGELV